MVRREQAADFRELVSRGYRKRCCDVDGGHHAPALPARPSPRRSRLTASFAAFQLAAVLEKLTQTVRPA
jgi:hypothetical protein